MIMRNRTIDTMKGLLILLVVLGHSVQYGFGNYYEKQLLFYDNYLFRAIYAFHMPLFMFISGYLFHSSNKKPFSQVLISKLKGIGIPFLVYYSLLYVLGWFMNHQDTFYLSDYLRKMKIEMWFLSSLLLNCFLVLVFTRLLSLRICQVVMFALSTATLFVSDDIIPGMHKFVFFFFILGYYYKDIGGALSLKTKDYRWFLPATILFVFSLFIYGRNIMIYEGGFCIIKDGTISTHQLYVDILRFSICIVGCFWFVGITNRIMNVFSYSVPSLCQLGKQTLAIYGMQSVMFVLLSYTMRTMEISIVENYVTPLLVCIVIIALCELCIWLCLRYRLTRLLFLGKK